MGAVGTLGERSVFSAEAGSAPEDRLSGLRLVVCDELALESQDDRHVTVVNTATAARMKLSLSAYRFLKAFERPRRIGEVVPDHALARILPQVRMLVDRQLLVEADTPRPPETARLRTAVPYKFCGAPAYAAPATPDFVILGVPYDLAGDIDSRLAPALIRQKSLEYPYQPEFGEGRPRGWFDVNRGAWILQGATIADAGDVPIEYGESQARFGQRVGRALGECCRGRTVPVILGGDRSVTGAAVAGLRSGRPLTVVQIGTDPAGAAAEGAGRHLLRVDQVERVISLGACDLAAGEAAGRGSAAYSVAMLRARGADEIVGAWGDGLSIYLSIDLALAAGFCMTAAADTLPPEPTVAELKAAIAAIGRAHQIVGIDLVGLDLQSRSPALAAVVACHLALAAMSAAHDRA